MNDARGVIKEKFAQFVWSLQDNRQENYEDLFCEQILFRTQTLGEFRGIQEAKERLKWYGPQRDVSRYKIYNNAIFAEEERGIQCAYVVALVGTIVDSYLHHFQFGGHYLIEWEKQEGTWKMSRVCYCLDMECGNTMFVANYWKLIDYTKYGGFDENPIVPLQDCPWRRYCDKTDWTEQEKIVDLYNRYAWGIDQNDFEIAASAMSERIWANIPGNPIYSKKEYLLMLQSKRNKENTMSHVGKVVNVEICGGYAKMYVWRYEPHRIGTKFLHIHNWHDMFYTVKYVFHAQLEGEEWKLTQVDYEMGVFSQKEDDSLYQ